MGRNLQVKKKIGQIFNKKWVGNVSIYFEKNEITRQIRQMVYKSCLYLLAVTCVTLALMISLIYIGNRIATKRRRPENRRISTKKINS